MVDPGPRRVKRERLRGAAENDARRWYAAHAMHGLLPPVVSVFATDGDAHGRGTDDAARRLAESVLADLPRARGMLLAVIDRGAASGFHPQVGTVRAFASVARAREIPTRACALGRAPSPDLVDALAREGVPWSDPHDPRTLAIRWPDSNRTVTLPHAWIGRHLCIVLPCISADAPRRGPMTAALASIADACGVGDDERPCELAARIVAGCFAGITLVVDADVALVRARPGRGSPRLVPVRRLFAGHRVPAPASWVVALARGFDGWLRQRVPSSAVRFVGPAAESPWTAAVGDPIGAIGWADDGPRRRAPPVWNPRAR